MEHFADDILPLLRSAVKGGITESDLNRLVKTAYRYAIVRLQQLINSRRLHLSTFGLSLEAVAFDCIAELFRRNETGRFIELEAYFSDERSLESLGTESAKHYFRRLVFAKLQDGLYRLYREHDPVLGRIIRNIKVEIRRNRAIVVHERLGEVYLSTCAEDSRYDHLPEFPLDELQAAVSRGLPQRKNTRDYLSRIFLALNGQEKYRRFYSLTGLAIIIKRMMLEEHIPLDEFLSIDESLLQHDVKSIVVETSAEMYHDLYDSYVIAGKIDKELFDQYWKAIEHMLHDLFVSSDGEDLSHPEYLMKYLRGLNKEEYRRTHRTYFEYMARTAVQRVRERLKELL